ncbi:Plasmodium exported protein, unknown function [Plasmodium gonderi]|uniref:Variable surface protein n=1 Tax=Plasmodium gonderi TaxID=77519 RepID=A0A1Y1JTG4_PLAGO|nr:Plasmodium exported protein, unknown function [Plasmodium gonderi]GAW83214.1 Plasmodium exported protein, unknown function [Plasmodium gonderi]
MRILLMCNMGAKSKIIYFINICTFTFLMCALWVYYNDENIFSNSVNKEHKIANVTYFIRSRLLAAYMDSHFDSLRFRQFWVNHDAERKLAHRNEYKLAKNIRMELANNVKMKTSNNIKTQLKEKKVKEYSNLFKETYPRRKKKKKSLAYVIFKKIDKYFEKRVYKNFIYIRNLQKDPTIKKSRLIKILFRRYRFFLIMPFVMKTFGLIIFIIRASVNLNSTPIIKTILLTMNALVSHVLSIISIICLIYIIVKRVQFDGSSKNKKNYCYMCNGYV